MNQYTAAVTVPVTLGILGWQVGDTRDQEEAEEDAEVGHRFRQQAEGREAGERGRERSMTRCCIRMTGVATCTAAAARMASECSDI